MSLHSPNHNNYWSLFELIGYGLWVLMIMISIIGNIKLYNRRKEMFIKKRSSFIVFGLNISFIFAICSTLFIQISTQYLTFLWQSAACYSWYTAFWLFAFFIITKNWIIYYKYKWTYYTIQSEWQRIINPVVSEDDKNHNWFIINNKTYGSRRFIYKLFGCLCFVGWVICLLCLIPVQIRLYQTQSFADANVNSKWILPSIIIIIPTTIMPLALYLIIAIKTPLFSDNFYIHWESKMHLKLVIILVIIYILTRIIAIIWNLTKAMIIGLQLIGLILTIMNIISTFMILKKNPQHRQWRNGASMHQRSQSRSSSQNLIAI